MRRPVLLGTHLSLHAVAAVVATAFGISGCGLSPLNHRIKIGEEPFVVFAAEGTDGNTDLFAASAGGGEAFQFTFTPLVEMHPKLDSAGDIVAFLRMHDTLPATPRFVVMMNLVSGSEAQIGLPPDAGRPLSLAWSPDARHVYVRTDRSVWQVTIPPEELHASPVPAAKAAAADSALDTWLGTPAFARSIPCVGGGICVVGSRGDTARLSEHGHDAMRWGSDSVAWFDGPEVVIRSLGPGRERHMAWTGLPAHPRDGSYGGFVPPPE